MFAYRLARVLGWVNVDAMLDSITHDQFQEWMQYAELEPFGDEWTQTSIVSAVTWNRLLAVQAAIGGKVRQAEWKSPDDFVPKSRRRKVVTKTNWAAHEAMMRGMIMGQSRG